MENKEKFYKSLQEERDRINDHFIIMGDLNDRVETKNERTERIIRNEGKIIALCIDNNLVIAYSMS